VHLEQDAIFMQEQDIMAQKVITVFGGGGFHRALCGAGAAARGMRVRVAERGPKNALG
jgi:hypothetical protein